MRFIVERNVGRLVEVKVPAGLELSEVQYFRTKAWLTLSTLTGQGVFVVDLLDTDVFTPEIADRMLELLVVDNPKVERSAYIVRQGGAFAQQVERILKEAATAGAPIPATARRAFYDKVDAQRWLEEVLDPDERERLRTVIAAM